MKKLNFELLYPSTININHSALLRQCIQKTVLLLKMQFFHCTSTVTICSVDRRRKPANVDTANFNHDCILLETIQKEKPMKGEIVKFSCRA